MQFQRAGGVSSDACFAQDNYDFFWSHWIFGFDTGYMIIVFIYVSNIPVFYYTDTLSILFSLINNTVTVFLQRYCLSHSLLI